MRHSHAFNSVYTGEIIEEKVVLLPQDFSDGKYLNHIMMVLAFVYLVETTHASGPCTRASRKFLLMSRLQKYGF